MAKDRLLENSPLTETTLFILLSLAGGPKHGYAIMKDVNALSQERLLLSTGTLYGAVKRLLAAGWIRQSGDDAWGANTRGRKDYELTDQGRAILHTEVARLKSVVAATELQLAE